jgi:ribonucleoside-diphosphate reductase beta chain
MTSNIINTSTEVDFTKQPMLFGETLGLQRFDVFKYPAFDQLTKRQMSYFWTPEEIQLTKDIGDYKKFTDIQKHIFTMNLSYQILLDSVQSRGTISCLLPIVSIPELETCITWWSAFETLHSRSYTYMIKNVYSKPSDVFDNILKIQPILERASSVTKYYNDAINLITQYRAGILSLDNHNDEYLLKKAVYLAIIAINILEGIRFYVSFACTFAFGELKLMTGSAKIISLIARDENIHLSISQHMINIIKEKENDLLFLEVVKDTQSEVIEMFKSAVEEEVRWADFLFENGSMLGLNAKLLGDYVKWLSGRRLQAIGYDKIYDISTADSANPLPWTKNWLSSSGKQTAPQEQQQTQYLVGSLDKNKQIELDSLFTL